MVDAAEPSILLSLATSFTLAFVQVVSCYVGSQVQPPAQQLLSDHVCSSRNGSLFRQLVQFVRHSPNSRSIYLAGFWEEDHIALHISSGLVVLSVGNLPGEVRDKESGMQDPSYGVVQYLRW